MNRRRFLECGMLGTAAAILPSCGPRAATSTSAGRFDVGTDADYPEDTVRNEWAGTLGFLVIRHNRRLYATSAICTHQACIVSASANGDHLRCPCHGSEYAISGRVTVGPALESLARYAIRKDERGRIIVDTTHKLEAQEWESDQGSVTVEG